MYQNVNIYDFRRAFAEIRPENFSYDGLAALFEFLEDQERDLGERFELDVIAICCDFSEYESDADAESAFDMSIEAIREETTVIDVAGGGVIVQDF